MFNMLNNRTEKGKCPAMMCKFLDSLSAISHGFSSLFGGPSYLLERAEVRNPAFHGVGLRIAFSVYRPAYGRTFNGRS
jgi:hypothetical protein